MARFENLPNDLHKLTDTELRRLLERLIKAQQQNNDTISGNEKGMVKEFNRLAADINKVAEHLGAEVDSAGNILYFTDKGVHPPAPSASEIVDLPQPSPGIYPEDGEMGPPGPPGARGATGPRGRQGTPIWGQDGEDAIVVPGGRGPRGPRGLQGVPFWGAEGEDGIGVPGRIGQDGATGATGAQGDPGDPGAPGADGADGRDGAPGMPGEDGDSFGMWVPPAPGSGGFVAHDLDAHGDVEFIDGDLTGGEIIYWNFADQKWDWSRLALDPDLGYLPFQDIVDPGPAADGEVIQYDTGSGGFIFNDITTATTTKAKWISADMMTADSASGAVLTEFGTSPDIHDAWVLRDGVADGVNFLFTVPDDWASGALTMYLYFSGSASFGASDTVRISQSYAHIAASGDMATASTTPTATDMDPGTGYVARDFYKSAGLTIGTPAAAGNLVRVQIERKGAHANDDYTGSVRLSGVLIEYTATTPPGPRGPAGGVGDLRVTTSSLIVTGDQTPDYYATASTACTVNWATISGGSSSAGITATFKLNGTDQWASSTKPAVPGGGGVSAERAPDGGSFAVAAGDKLTLNITAGTTGPVVVVLGVS